MKNSRSVKGHFLAKFFSGLVFIVTSFITIFSFICIIFMTAFGAFDSSKDAAINSMRDSLYYRIVQNYMDDAIDSQLLFDGSFHIVNGIVALEDIGSAVDLCVKGNHHFLWAVTVECQIVNPNGLRKTAYNGLNFLYSLF